MSKKTQLYAAMMAVISHQGGSHLTREARENTSRIFVATMAALGMSHMRRVEDIAGRHLRKYVSARLRAGIQKRTIQNELAHIRSIVRVAGATGVANAPELSNKALGVGGQSRRGTKTPLTSEDYERVRALAILQKREGMAALLGLELTLGLRGNEALHALPDVLTRWRRELVAGGAIEVLAGTKGGRRRIVRVHNVDAALAAIDEAHDIALKQGGFLIVRKNGQPAGSLKSARSIYHGWANRAGIQPHSARYAFTEDQMAAYLREGKSSREARISTALDLGHGDGRGRWVQLVYGQTPAPSRH